MKITELEKVVYNAILDTCYHECEADLIDIHESTGIKINSIKGVIGSLTKKGLVEVTKEKRDGKIFLGINPINEDGFISFGCDTYSEEEYKKFYKSFIVYF
jgi:DNA-binding MarR family transcriptional regulator